MGHYFVALSQGLFLKGYFSRTLSQGLFLKDCIPGLYRLETYLVH